MQVVDLSACTELNRMRLSQWDIWGACCFGCRLSTIVVALVMACARSAHSSCQWYSDLP